MLALVDRRILMLEGFIALNAGVRHDLLEQGLDMSNLDEYLAKYPTAVRAVKKKYPEHRNLKDKHSLCLFVGIYNQERCRNLIFEILKRQSASWWD
jgi:hypothetical protein